MSHEEFIAWMEEDRRNPTAMTARDKRLMEQNKS
jgi:hypothetical protein